jgi:hypothetical protein
MTVNNSQVIFLDYSVTNVTNSAYVQLVLSTSISVSKLEISDSSSSIVKLAIGNTGSQTDICTNALHATVVVPIYIPAGTTLWVQAVNTATISSGFIVVSLIG